ncbi:MAG TPA: nucleotidyltransferase family protein [Chthoniobacterales bacterium]
MNVLILAAGYATRLYPLTLNKAKPLLEVAGKPMIEWIVGHLEKVAGLKTIYIVTNDRFAPDFTAWAESYKQRQRGYEFKVINDGSTSDSDKLGAIGDINLALSREDLATDDLLVVAGDNLFSNSLDEFVAFAQDKEATVAVYDVGSRETIKNYGCVTIDAKGVITHFEEKPSEPASTLAAIALYYYARDVLPLFRTYLAAGNNPDQPGRFLQWLYTRKPVNTCQLKGLWLDIGSKETLEEANRIFQQFA